MNSADSTLSPIVITQAARDAAASYGRATLAVSPREAEAIQRGEWDDLARVRWFAEFLGNLSSPASVEREEENGVALWALKAERDAQDMFASYMGDPEGNDDTDTARIEAARVIEQAALEALSHPQDSTLRDALIGPGDAEENAATLGRFGWLEGLISDLKDCPEAMAAMTKVDPEATNEALREAEVLLREVRAVLVTQLVLPINRIAQLREAVVGLRRWMPPSGQDEAIDEDLSFADRALEAFDGAGAK